jgi:hypothetical protein
VDHSLDEAQTTGTDSSDARSRIAPAPTLVLPADRAVPSLWVWAVCGFLLLAVGLVYGQTLGHDFTGYDDDGFITHNEHVIPGVTQSGL